MYGRRNFVNRNELNKPLHKPRLLLGIAANDVDKAHLVADWLVNNHDFFAADSLDDLHAIRYELEPGQHLVVRYIDLDSDAACLRSRGGCVVHVPGAVKHVQIGIGDYVLSVQPDDPGFGINMQMVVQALLDELTDKAA